MAKYHINPKGEPGVCRAGTRPCPYGDASEHFTTSDEARSAYESMAQQEAEYYSRPQGMLGAIPASNRRGLLDFMAEESTVVHAFKSDSWRDRETDHKYFGLDGEQHDLKYNYYGWTDYDTARHLAKCGTVVPDNVELLDTTYSTFSDTMSPADQTAGLSVYGGSETSPSSIHCKCGKHGGLMLRYEGTYYELINGVLARSQGQQGLPDSLKKFTSN